MRARCSLETEPWCDLAMTGALPSVAPGLAHRLGRDPVAGRGLDPGPLGGDLVEPGGQPLGEPAGVGEDDRRAVLLDQVDHPLLDVRPDARDPLARALVVVGVGVVERRCRRGWSCPRPAPPPRGPTASRWAGRRPRPGRCRRGSAPPPRPGARSRTARCAAPAARAGRRAARGRLPRWAPRLVPATACTSSRITVCTPRSASRACEVSIRNSDSGVVIMTSGGAVTILRRSAALVSPERTPTRTSGSSAPRRGGGVADAGQRGAQVALDVDGERLERGDVEDPAALLLVLRRGVGEQPVDRPQEGAQRLARPGRGHDQRVPARRRWPPRRLPGPASARRTPPRTRSASVR